MTPEQQAGFLAEFFGTPNQLTLDRIGRDPRLRVFHEYVRDLQSGLPSVLPYWQCGHVVDYYGVAGNEHDFRHLGLELNAFVGCSHSTFRMKRAVLDGEHPADAILLKYGIEYVYHFCSDPQKPAASPRIAEQLRRMAALSRQRQARQPLQRRPVHVVLRDYHMALQAGNRAGAEEAISAIQRDGLLDAVNLLFLRTVVISRFSTLRELEDSGLLLELVRIPRPLRVTDALVSLVYRAELGRFEANEDVSGAIVQFRKLRNTYPDIYRSWQGLHSAEAAKSFLLAALSAEPPDTELRDLIAPGIAQYRVEDRTWLETLISAFPSPAISPTVSGTGSEDRELLRVMRAPASLENVRLLCRFAAFSDALDLREAIRTQYSRLSEQERRDLRATKLGSQLLDELLQDDTIPRSWYEWLCRLKTAKVFWSEGTRIVQHYAPEWPSPTSDNAHTRDLLDLLLELQDRPELMTVLPQLIDAVQLDSGTSRPEVLEILQLCMGILASYTEGGINDLMVWKRLSETVLEMGVSSETHKRIHEEGLTLWQKFGSAATIDFATEFLDIALYYPCLDEPGRLRFFQAVAAQASVFRRLLDPCQCAFLTVLASDFGQSDWREAFAEKGHAFSDQGGTVFQGLRGKVVAIYSLSERMSRRAKTLLEELCGEVKVRLNADHVASAQLKQLAREADIFIVNTRFATHAATEYISAQRDAGKVTLYHDARGSQSLLTVLESHLQQTEVKIS